MTRVLAVVLLVVVASESAAAAQSAREPSSAGAELPATASATPAGDGDRSSADPRSSPAAVSRDARSGPGVRVVVRMALKAARRFGVARVRALARRARLAGLLPHVRLSAERGLEQDLSSSTTAQSDRTLAAVGDAISLGATLTFDLDRLVFAPEEVRLLSIERWLGSDERKLVTEVVRLYYQRRRLLREQASARAPDPELTDGISEIEAMLDALTGGEFASALEAPGR